MENTGTTPYIPQLDRWELWMVVKSLDLKYSSVVPLLQGLGITIYRDDNGAEYISKDQFKHLLYSVAETK